MISLLKKPLSVCQSGWREIRNAFLVIPESVGGPEQGARISALPVSGGSRGGAHGPRHPPPPSYFYTKLRPEGPKTFFFGDPPPYLKVWIGHCKLYNCHWFRCHQNAHKKIQILLLKRQKQIVSNKSTFCIRF